MTKKRTPKEHRKFAEMLRYKDGFERRPGTEPDRIRVLLAAKPKKKRG